MPADGGPLTRATRCSSRALASSVMVFVRGQLAVWSAESSALSRRSVIQECICYTRYELTCHMMGVHHTVKDLRAERRKMKKRPCLHALTLG